MATNKRSEGCDWGMVGGGLLVILVGILLYVFPGFSAASMAMLAGGALIAVAVFEFWVFYKQRKLGVTSPWAIVSALCCVVLGIIFICHPLVSASVMIWLLGWFVIIYGIFTIIIAIGLFMNGGFAWWLMLINGIIALVCGIMFNAQAELFIIFLGLLLIVRGITMAVYGFMAPNDARYL